MVNVSRLENFQIFCVKIKGENKIICHNFRSRADLALPAGQSSNVLFSGLGVTFSPCGDNPKVFEVVSQAEF